MKRILIPLVIGVLAVGAWLSWDRDTTAPPPASDAGHNHLEPLDSLERETTPPASSSSAAEPGKGALEVFEEEEFDVEAVPLPAPATWTDDVRATALEEAVAAVAAFAQPDLDYDTWWEQVEPHLSLQAQVVYNTVDPRLVPVRAVTGAPVLIDESSTLLTEVHVPTDAGPYVVLLVRADGNAPWLAEQIRPLEQP